MRIRVITAALAISLVAAAASQAVTRPKGQHLVLTLHNKTWSCKGPQQGSVINVREDGGDLDAVHLDSGCTGTVTLHIWTNQRDGVKLHGGAHDLVVTGDLYCGGKVGKVHQDGVQAMGGTRVTFENWKENCVSGNNGGLFFASGINSNSLPTDVTCDHCSIYYGNASWHISRSLRSGATNSTAYRGPGGAAPKGCWRIEKSAQSPVDKGNTCLPKPPDSWVK